MELFFLALLVLFMATALGSGFPVAFSLPGSAILTVGLAALAGWLFTGNVDAFFAQGGPAQWLTAGVTNFRGVYWEAERDTLIAIPLFIFMGIMLQRSKIAEDLLVTMAQLFGPVRGGLGISVVFVGALLAATTGIVGATVVAMGLISLPAMLRNNYSHPLATGTIAASGTLGQIIPPSIVLIILADQLASAADQASSARKALYKLSTGELTLPSEFDVISTSAGEMFLGAFVPGLVLVGVYIVFIALYALVRPKVAPTVPYDGKYDMAFAGRVAMVLVPPLALIFIVLGSIIMGIATVNQAGAIGAVGAMIMSGYRLSEGRRWAYLPAVLALVSVVVILVATQIHPVNVRLIHTSEDVLWLSVAGAAVVVFIAAVIWSGWRAFVIEDTLRGVMVETAKTTSLVFIILIGAAMLTASFRAFGGEDLVREFLTGLPGGFWTQFAIVMLVIFVLGFFLDFIEIAVVVVPIVAPILLADPSANVTAVWLGVMIGINIQTSFLTPPFGFALFYLRGVAPAVVRTISMYKGVIPFIIMQLMVLAFVAVTPRLVNYLPQRVSLTAVTAPPPVNPKLQVCIEDYVGRKFAKNGDEIRAAIASVRQLDLGSLPDKMQKRLADSFAKAGQSFDLLAEVEKTQKVIADATPAYKPLHVQVRDIQADMRRHDDAIKALKVRLGLVNGDDEAATRLKQQLNDRIAEAENEKKALEASIPTTWDERHKAFSALLSQQKRARLTYRRTVDQAYEPVSEAVDVIAAANAMGELGERLNGLRQVAAEKENEEIADKIASVSRDLSAIPGTSDIRSALSEARRAVRGNAPDKAAAVVELDKAIALYERDLAWRKQAASDVLPGLQAYERKIIGTIGIRKQEKLTRDQALDIAACQAYHRDISLAF